MEPTTERRPQPLSEAQAARAALMIRPERFASNPETSATNSFQHASPPGLDLAAGARDAFAALAAKLTAEGIAVEVFPGRSDGAAPDEIFPNNWISFHADGTVVLYPMLAPSRRLERRPEIIAALAAERGYRVAQVIDLSGLEQRGWFLEGTGSLVLDRSQRIAYACLSPRTHPAALAEFARRLDYEIVSFEAHARSGQAIYHTNVLLAIGTRFALLASETLGDPDERRQVIDRLSGSRELIEIDLTELEAFAGNALELTSPSGPIIVLSRRAYDALAPAKRDRLAAHGRLVTSEVSQIETHGGGGVRCMLAELALPRERPRGLEG